ncbi:Prolyl 4-hydroxylase subunit alpha-3 [Orchesella cincta]|uniref:Prolyl 4-hydroxylase subunit alpha-3 n=1 Tax=Orchesella cincta TaxID=48709 RepID=A0A1D2MQI3_ORCCI|nr:Prolyl 4-hydroxylase subunit alpha-3 [Orchesella cincta]
MFNTMKGTWFNILLVLLSIKLSCGSEQEAANEEYVEDQYLLFDATPLEPPSFAYGSLHSLDRLMEWSMKEESIVEVLGSRLELLQTEYKLITSYLKDYNESTRMATEGLHDPSKNTPEGRGRVVGSSAVLAHRMTNRYTSTISKLQELISSDAYIDNQRNINETIHPELIKMLKDREEKSYNGTFTTEDETPEALPIWPWPHKLDLYRSDLSFIHLHEIYGFFPAQMRVGLEVDTKYGGFLNAKQCFAIGAHALSRYYYYMAIEWLELTKNLLLSADEEDRSIPLDIVSSLLDIAIKEHNLGIKYNGTEEFYTRPTYEGQPTEERLRYRKYIYHSPTIRENPQFNAVSQYWALCSGVTFQTPKTQKSLKCFYEMKRHPYLYINPLKTEILSENPPVFQFYDVLANDTIEDIKAKAVPRLQLSEVVGTDDVEQITKHRTSAGTFMRYKEMPKVYEHSEIISGLKLLEKASEMAQVVEYTYGRYYIYHADALEDEEPEEERGYMTESGDRVATLLYYLETAEYGGDTPFCAAGVNARRVRASAVLWYNMYRNGTVREDVYHGACPVIHGHKIIINHWIHYNQNWNYFPCSLNPLE